MYGIITGITDTEDINYCPRCGTEIHFCQECGKKMHKAIEEFLSESEDSGND